MDTIGGRIQTLREQRDLSRRELAERADITIETVRRIETGLDFRVGTIRKIASVLGVDVRTLIPPGEVFPMQE